MTFWRAVRFHLKNMVRRKELFFALLASIVLLLLTSLADLYNLWESDVLTLCPAWMYFGFASVSMSHYSKMLLQMFMMLFLPFVSSLAYSYCSFDDHQTGVYKFLFSRMKRSVYYGSAALATFLGAFFILFLPLLLRELVFILAVPLSSPILTPGYPVSDLIFRNVNFWKSLALNNPYLYFFIYTLIPSLVGGLLGLLSFSLSLYYKKNRFLVLTLPGILTIAFSFICSITGNTGMVLGVLVLPPQNMSGIKLTPLIVEVAILIGINLLALIGKVRFQKDELS